MRRSYPLALVFVCTWVLSVHVCVYVNAHGHVHEEEEMFEERPAYKYSKEANENAHEKKVHGHGHSHGGHGHSHDGHGHSHDGHGHSHDGHGHSHENVHTQKDNSKNVHTHTENAKNVHTHTENAKNVHTENAHEKPKSAHKKRTSEEVWVGALSATLLISIAPYLILFFIPINSNSNNSNSSYLKILLAFASGGLLADAFLHLIPHAVMAKAQTDGSNEASKSGSEASEHTHSHAHSHAHTDGDAHAHAHDMSIGLSVLGGIIAFLVIEKIVRIIKGGHAHSHSHGVTQTQKNGDGKEGKSKKKKGDKVEGDIKVAGYLNLAADFTHNLTDGLAIGASFLAGKNVGIVTTLTIFLHEIPHEIGDFAILIQSGCTKRKAMMLQLLTALGALTGTVISLLAEGADDSAISWILPFTAGGFIYIGTVSVIPELLEGTKLWQSVCEIIALLAGVGLMMVIAHLEELGHEH